MSTGFSQWYLIDIVFVVMIVLTIAIHTKRGFIKTLLQNLKGIVAIILAFSLTPLIVGIVKDNLVNDWFEGTITTPFVETAIEAGDNFNFENIAANLPESAMGVIEMIDKDGGLSNFKGTGVEFAREFGGRLEGFLINIVSYVITYIALWIILLIALSIVLKIIEKSIKIPVLKTGDHILGFVWGALSAYLEVSLLVVLVPLVFGYDFMIESVVTRFLYENSLFISLIANFL